VKLVMTLLARNEVDIVDAQIAFHLNAGVDFVVATDNRSDDGTTEILERYEREGYLHLLREEADDMRQREWVTRMARLAATDFGADWVINSDADEFWWPREGSLKEVLELVPERYGIIRGFWRHFLPRLDGDQFFAERMTIRLCAPAPPGAKWTLYHAHQKAVHRADPEVVVQPGNHDAIGDRLEPLRTWFPIEILHFSFRSVEQLARKAEGGWVRNPDVGFTEYQARLHAAAFDHDEVAAFFRRSAVSDEDLRLGLQRGHLAVDTRLRDALRTLRADDRSFRLPSRGPVLAFERPDLADTAAHAAEVAVLAEFDGIERTRRRLETLERRVDALL
jgi:Glycosyl transferase family 2